MIRKNRPAPSKNGESQPSFTNAELLAEFQRIEEVWKLAETKLAETLVPIDVRVKVGEGPIGHADSPVGEYIEYLAYTRFKGARRICMIIEEDYWNGPNDEDPEIRPIVECPVDVRIGMFEQFGKLYSEAESVARSYVPKIRDAVEKFKNTLEWIDL